MLREITYFLEVAKDLELAGLLWRPEIGDEISQRSAEGPVSVLVDTAGMTPGELRSVYLWLPTVEQIVLQFEARQAILFHSGLELSQASLCYKTVLQSNHGLIESSAVSLRSSMGLALRKLLLADGSQSAIN